VTPEQWAAEKGIIGVVDALRAGGAKVELTPEQIELVGRMVLGLLQLVTNGALKRAAEAGIAAAAAVTTVEEANAVMEAAAAAVEPK
jgi:hypothetical protein